jgi:hypothetical protein
VAEKGKNKQSKAEIPTIMKKQAVLTDESMQSFAHMLDSEGQEHDENVLAIMKDRMKKPKK